MALVWDLSGRGGPKTVLSRSGAHLSTPPLVSRVVHAYPVGPLYTQVNCAYTSTDT